jgi:hypothetical protein
MGETLDFRSSNGMEILLFKIFPNLFAKEVVQDIRIADKQLSDENGTNWSWQWINSLTDFEEQELNNLRELLVGFRFNGIVLTSGSGCRGPHVYSPLSLVITCY